MAVKKATNATETTETKAVEETTTETTEAVETANTASEKTTLVYIGPSLPKGQLKSNTIFNGTVEEIMGSVKEITEKIPIVAKMFVPVEKLAERKAQVKTPGNIYNKFYTDINSVSIKLLEEE